MTRELPFYRHIITKHNVAPLMDITEDDEELPSGPGQNKQGDHLLSAENRLIPRCL